MAAIIRVQTPDKYRVTFLIDREKDPALYHWLTNLPWGSRSESIRELLNNLIATGVIDPNGGVTLNLPPTRDTTAAGESEAGGVSSAATPPQGAAPSPPPPPVVAVPTQPPALEGLPAPVVQAPAITPQAAETGPSAATLPPTPVLPTAPATPAAQGEGAAKGAVTDEIKAALKQFNEQF